MKIKYSNILLVISIISSIILSSCGNKETGSFTDSRDGHVYKWVKIGKQVWMSKNLAYTGSDIKHITDGNEWYNNSDYDGWCYYENNDSLGTIYGVLYQWEAAKTACPNGWHLPTHAEWTQLENYLKEHRYSYDGVVGHTGIAKSLATNNGWSVSSSEGSVGNPDFPDFRNKSGFSALPSGDRDFNPGKFYNVGNFAVWWSSTEGSNSTAYDHYIYYTKTGIDHSDYNKSTGFSVRCIRD